MTVSAHRPRRSCLYMPGANPRALEKAKSLAADAVIFDLEDAVAPEAKLEARDTVCAAVKAGGYGPREVIIRINGLDTEWGLDDLHNDYEDAPTDGSAWFDSNNNNLSQKQGNAVLRGGSWDNDPGTCRSAYRINYDRAERDSFFNVVGFRLACGVGRVI